MERESVRVLFDNGVYLVYLLVCSLRLSYTVILFYFNI